MLVFDFDLDLSFQNGFHVHYAYQSSSVSLGILGPSGAGKTLLFRMIAGIQKPDSGYFRVNGQTLVDTEKNIDLSPQARKVGLMFQHYALFPHLTVIQNIAFSLKKGLFNPSKHIKNEAVDYWLEKLKITDIAYHYPHQISGGQAQRVALARTCITEPSLLLLDEPFSALDADLKNDMRSLIKDVRQELDIPLLLISHDRADTDFLTQDCFFIIDERRDI
ncbi:sulfate/molybdate ABC transporter ATP-binding protein [Basilea psittacipulmonis]|uniref:ABC transporter domain-containing protein n=1 Tax=Basilea psittacipulmonis DSM 24701 TaxID=1072685 RepID=A0A077DH51_9BURK|nr:ATP-binding cassette domain-containing protein [Basilea psittacipulmonis]AIL32762.1 hypothetical protein IX83_05065 [Basilea psittacipulmonis DSM 24701]